MLCGSYYSAMVCLVFITIYVHMYGGTEDYWWAVSKTLFSAAVRPQKTFAKRIVSKAK